MRYNLNFKIASVVFVSSFGCKTMHGNNSKALEIEPSASANATQSTEILALTGVLHGGGDEPLQFATNSRNYLISKNTIDEIRRQLPALGATVTLKAVADAAGGLIVLASAAGTSEPELPILDLTGAFHGGGDEVLQFATNSQNFVVSSNTRNDIRAQFPGLGETVEVIAVQEGTHARLIILEIKVERPDDSQ